MWLLKPTKKPQRNNEPITKQLVPERKEVFDPRIGHYFTRTYWVSQSGENWSLDRVAEEFGKLVETDPESIIDYVYSYLDRLEHIDISTLPPNIAKAFDDLGITKVDPYERCIPLITGLLVKSKVSKDAALRALETVAKDGLHALRARSLRERFSHMALWIAPFYVYFGGDLNNLFKQAPIFANLLSEKRLWKAPYMFPTALQTMKNLGVPADKVQKVALTTYEGLLTLIGDFVTNRSSRPFYSESDLLELVKLGLRIAFEDICLNGNNALVAKQAPKLYHRNPVLKGYYHEALIKVFLDEGGFAMPLSLYRFVDSMRDLKGFWGHLKDEGLSEMIITEKDLRDCLQEPMLVSNGYHFNYDGAPFYYHLLEMFGQTPPKWLQSLTVCRRLRDRLYGASEHISLEEIKESDPLIKSWADEAPPTVLPPNPPLISKETTLEPTEHYQTKDFRYEFLAFRQQAVDYIDTRIQEAIELVTSDRFERDFPYFATDIEDASAVKAKACYDLMSKMMKHPNFDEIIKESDFAPNDWDKLSTKAKRRWVMGMVAGLISVWAETACDDHPLAHAIQIAAKDEFGLSDDYLDYLKRNTGAFEAGHVFYRRNQRFLRLFLRTMYEHTQKLLKAAGFDRQVLVCRGVDYAINPEDRITCNPLSSWTFSMRVASVFAGSEGRVIFGYVPRETILSFQTGFGCLDEGEAVIIGVKGKGTYAWRTDLWEED